MRDRIFKNLPYKVLSVLIALGLWFIVREERVDSEFRVPVAVTVNDELVIVSDPPRTIKVSVSGTRFAVDRLRPDTYEAVIAATEPGPAEVRIQEQQLNIPAEVRIEEVTPARFEVLLERKTSESLSVRPRLLGLPAPGYTVGAPKVDPAKAKIEGASSLIRDLQWIYTEPISIEGKTETFTGEYVLSLPAAQVWQVEKGPVRVTVPIFPPTPEPPDPDASPEASPEASPSPTP